MPGVVAHRFNPGNADRARDGFDNVQRVARGEKPLWVIPELRE